jgi:hypothetical protein
MKISAAIFAIAVLFLGSAACMSQPSAPAVAQPTTPSVAQPSTPTITSDDNICVYSGPGRIKADPFTFQWVMNGKEHENYGIVAIQVEEGHSLDEFIGKVIKSPTPSWLSLLRYEVSRLKPGPWTKEVTMDLTLSARFQPKPVYFLCDYEDENGDNFVNGICGPVEVEE